MDEIDIQVLTKAKDDSFYKRNNRKRRIKIILKSLFFRISILINILFCLKLIIDLKFSITKKNILTVGSKRIFLTNFSNILNTSSISDNYSNDNNSEYHSNDNNSLYDLLLHEISNNLHKSITRIDTVVLRANMRFGNHLIALNNAIYFCEILKCREILVDDSVKFIKNEIFYRKFNISIKFGHNADCYKQGVVCAKSSLFYGPFKIKIPEHRFFVFQEEFLSNVPKYESNENDLYIHIRSGDIFSTFIHGNYAQPPLCFYEFIINNFHFEKIFIISEDKRNPVIDVLLNKYTNIKFLHQDFSHDVSYIINAQNLIISSSSFSLNLARLSSKLKNLFVYDITPKEEKEYWLIDDNKYNENLKKFVMKVSDKYKSEMFPWISNEKQKYLMLNSTCNGK